MRILVCPYLVKGSHGILTSVYVLSALVALWIRNQQKEARMMKKLAKEEDLAKSRQKVFHVNETILMPLY